MPTPKNQKKIEYLSRYQKLGKRIEQLCAERAVWLSKACKITQTITDMPKAKNGVQGNSGELEKYVEIGEEITKELQKLHRMRREIRSIISTLGDDTLQTLMLYRYINGMTFEEIAVKMNFSWRWTITLHGRALEKLSL